MKIAIPQRANLIMKEISDAGYESYVVGGCVRDSLLEIIPKDWDITTDAKPETIIRIFKDKGYKVVPTGLKHGTVTVIIDGEDFQITTHRIDGIYEDHRRPSNVVFASKIKEDLARRDFTINAMAYNKTYGLIDYFNGYEDVKDRRIKCVGDPNQRFKEDALRIMRAIRFMAQLGFQLDDGTQRAIEDNTDLLENVSMERIRDEFSKIIMADNPSIYVQRMMSLGVMKYIVPELYECDGFHQHNPHHRKDVLGHTLEVLDHTENDLILRLSALFHDIGKPKVFTMDEKGIGHFYSHHKIGAEITKRIMKRLRYDKKTSERVAILVKEHMSRLEEATDKGIKRFINRLGADNLDRFFKLQAADVKATVNNDIRVIWDQQKRIEQVLKAKEPLSKRDLEINGSEIIDMGIPQGREVGRVLDELMEAVLENPNLNKKEILMGLVRNKISQ